jgi:DNA-binding NtrC family response regulator
VSRGTLALTIHGPSLPLSLADDLRQAGFTVQRFSTIEEVAAEAISNAFDVVLASLDLNLEQHRTAAGVVAQASPGTPLIAIAGRSSTKDIVETLLAGAVDVLEWPVSTPVLCLTIDRTVANSRMRRELRTARRNQRAATGSMLSKSSAMMSLARTVSRVANMPSSVLILGESGTGKELVARELHQQSERRDAPFVAINCAAMPEHLLESELFGHIKGAFTDAHTSREGLLIRASHGTLFLDEIGDMPPAVQPKLLRALQDRVVRPVGGDTDIPFHARIVAATHQDLDKAVENKTFRADLLYRLDVIRLEIPPLRARANDVLLLAHHFLDRFANSLHSDVRTLSPAAARVLLSYPWPGNVRELQNCMERAVAMAEGDVIDAQDLPTRLSQWVEAAPEAASADRLQTLQSVERAHIYRVLRACSNNKARTAKVLGIDRKTLHRKLTLFGSDETPHKGQNAPHTSRNE